MKRRSLLSLIGFSAIYASLPKRAVAHNPNLVFSAGTQIRDVHTNELICTANKDISKTDYVCRDNFDWAWPKPVQYSAIDENLTKAFLKARYDYHRQAAILV